MVQTHVGEDLLDHWLLEDRRNDLQLTLAVRAILQKTDVEHALEHPRLHVITPPPERCRLSSSTAQLSFPWPNVERLVQANADTRPRNLSVRT